VLLAPFSSAIGFMKPSAAILRCLKRGARLWHGCNNNRQGVACSFDDIERFGRNLVASIANSRRPPVPALHSRCWVVTVIPSLLSRFVDSKHYSVEFENEKVRILRIKYGPHENRKCMATLRPSRSS
jgi:hypothetical protein